jgi:periplasmic copper chaperone A
MNVAHAVRTVIAPVLLAGALLSGCSDDPTETAASPAAGISAQIGQVSLRDVFVLGGENGATIQRGGSAPVYLTLANAPGEVETMDSSGTIDPQAGTDVLTTVTSAQAASVQIVGGPISLPAGQDVQVGPAAKIVLRGLKQALQSGQFVSVTFRFKRSGTGTLNVPIQAREGDLQSYSPAP